MALESLVKIMVNNKWWEVPKIVDYEVQYCKLWSSDTGRSMTGENKGTLIGIFPKIVLKIGHLTESEMADFLTAVNQARAIVNYYDTELKTYRQNTFYFGDAQDQLHRQKNMSHKPISISIIACKRR